MGRKTKKPSHPTYHAEGHTSVADGRYFHNGWRISPSTGGKCVCGSLDYKCKEMMKALISNNDNKRCALLKLCRNDNEDYFKSVCGIFGIQPKSKTIYIRPTHFPSSNLEIDNKGPVKDAVNDGPHFYKSIIKINGKENIRYVPLPSREIIDEKKPDEGVEVQYDGSPYGEDGEGVEVEYEEKQDASQDRDYTKERNLSFEKTVSKEDGNFSTPCHVARDDVIFGSMSFDDSMDSSVSFNHSMDTFDDSIDRIEPQSTEGYYSKVNSKQVKTKAKLSQQKAKEPEKEQSDIAMLSQPSTNHYSNLEDLITSICPRSLTNENETAGIAHAKSTHRYHKLSNPIEMLCDNIMYDVQRMFNAAFGNSNDYRVLSCHTLAYVHRGNRRLKLSKEGLYSMRIMFIPIMADRHISLICVFPNEKVIFHLDPAYQRHHDSQLYFEKTKSLLTNKIDDFDATEWKCIAKEENQPQQAEGTVSCGIFTFMFIRHMYLEDRRIQEKNLTILSDFKPMNLTSEDIEQRGRAYVSFLLLQSFGANPTNDTKPIPDSRKRGNDFRTPTKEKLHHLDPSPSQNSKKVDQKTTPISILEQKDEERTRQGQRVPFGDITNKIKKPVENKKQCSKQFQKNVEVKSEITTKEKESKFKSIGQKPLEKKKHSKEYQKNIEVKSEITTGEKDSKSKSIDNHVSWGCIRCDETSIPAKEKNVKSKPKASIENQFSYCQPVEDKEPQSLTKTNAKKAMELLKAFVMEVNDQSSSDDIEKIFASAGTFTKADLHRTRNSQRKKVLSLLLDSIGRTFFPDPNQDKSNEMLVDSFCNVIDEPQSEKLYEKIGKVVVEEIQALKKPMERRPLMAALPKSGCSRKDAMSLLGIKIQPTEFAQANAHARIVGIGKPVEKLKVQHRRSKIKMSEIDNMMSCIKSKVEQTAYGTKNVQSCDGQLTEISSIKRKGTVQSMYSDYVQSTSKKIETALLLELVEQMECEVDSDYEKVHARPEHETLQLLLKDERFSSANLILLKESIDCDGLKGCRCEYKCPDTGHRCEKMAFHSLEHSFRKQSRLTKGIVESLNGTPLFTEDANDSHKVLALVLQSGYLSKGKVEEITRDAIPQSGLEGCRCTHVCPKSNLPCTRPLGHKAPKNHRYKRDGILSYSFMSKLIGTFTNGKIKTLAGLDNVDVNYGHDNFLEMKKIGKELSTIGNLSPDILKDLEDHIDRIQNFHKTNFIDHVHADSAHCCTCLHCGFSDKDDEIVCEKEHLPPCQDCNDSFFLISRLQDILEKVKDEKKLEESDIDDFLTIASRIERCKWNLEEYRAHIMQKHWEAIEEDQFFRNLRPGEVAVITDWKMKILEQYFRENQERFFGKKGFSLVGHMCVFGSELEDKDVEYHFYLTEDTKQDANNVLSTKQDLYKKLAKRGFDKIHFRADGAQCFAQPLMKAFMPLWEKYTGAKEISYKISVSGCGKTELDGLFGILMHLITEVVGGGESFTTPEQLMKIFVDNPLKGCHFHLYKPDRSVQHKIQDQQIPALHYLNRVYHLKADVDGRGGMRGWRRSDMGDGKHFTKELCENAITFADIQERKELELGRIKTELDKLESELGISEREYEERSDELKEQEEMVEHMEEALPPCPNCTVLQTTYEPPKDDSNFSTRHGKSFAERSSSKRKSRRIRKKRESLDKQLERIKQIEAGQYHHCKCKNEHNHICLRYFDRKGDLINHVQSGKHEFPPIDSKTAAIRKFSDNTTQGGFGVDQETNRMKYIRCKSKTFTDDNTVILHKDDRIGDHWYSKGCYNSRRVKSTRFTPALVKDLEDMFLQGENGGQKVTAEIAYRKLKEMKREGYVDRKKYSANTDNPNGPLPTQIQIKRWFSIRNKKGPPKPRQETEKALKLRCEGFSLPTTTKCMLLKLLELKDIRSRPGWSVSDLEQLCIDNDILERSEKKRSKKVLMIAMLSLYNERHQPVK